MDFVVWVLFGLIVGIIVNLLDPNPEAGGVVPAVILGVLGSVLSGFLANLIFGIELNGFNFASLLVAVGGAIILLFIGRLYQKGKNV